MATNIFQAAERKIMFKLFFGREGLDIESKELYQKSVVKITSFFFFCIFQSPEMTFYALTMNVVHMKKNYRRLKNFKLFKISNFSSSHQIFSICNTFMVRP